MTEEMNGDMPLEENERMLYVFTDHDNVRELETLIASFYYGCRDNMIGIEQRMNHETGVEDVVLVGVSHTPQGVERFPLAVVLKAEDVAKYREPEDDRAES